MPRHEEQFQTMRVLGAGLRAPVRTALEVAGRLGIDDKAARARLRTLIARGDVERLPNGTYRLTAQGAERLRVQDRRLKKRRGHAPLGRAV
ncbi:type IV toxin-antitoxin system AbiEi family antitoxin domain-containing protein [Deinococcus murrayi]|uniref:type IV toxin-antitoxin system AbiEi family antitoxin domain-containing protein n=1 Tax=Deinococcus murrayi TaxID=68910 RepID=UPI0004810257|nr:type IV toxin-antitoxin system AbiEi family antitoxin domain-containing protein [Deinococcus murrayi]